MHSLLHFLYMIGFEAGVNYIVAESNFEIVGVHWESVFKKRE